MRSIYDWLWPCPECECESIGGAFTVCGGMIGDVELILSGLAER